MTSTSQGCRPGTGWIASMRQRIAFEGLAFQPYGIEELPSQIK